MDVEFSITFWRCFSTVLILMWSQSAVSLVALPSATAWSTSISREVRLAGFLSKRGNAAHRFEADVSRLGKLPKRTRFGPVIISGDLPHGEYEAKVYDKPS